MKHSLLIVAALACCWLLQPAQAKRAPNLEFKDLAGKTQKIADLRGSISVVNFWATWCVPCREELPLLTRLNEEYAGKVHFVAASADEPKNHDKVEKLVATNQLTMDIWVGADLDMLERAGLGNELPATLILDDQGEVVARVLGEAHEEDLRQPLDWLLGGRTGTAPQGVTKRY